MADGDETRIAPRGQTTLPSTPDSPRDARWFAARPTSLAGAGALLVLLVVGGLVLHRHHTHTKTAPVTAKPTSTVPVIADSESALTDVTSVQKDVRSLLGHTFAHSPVSIPRASAAPATATTLAPQLRLDDPALASCAAEIEAGGDLLGIDRVTYQGAASLLIVTTGDTVSQAIAWVVGPRCAQPGAGGIRTIVTTAR